MKIGLVCALEREIEMIREGWSGEKEHLFGRVRVTEVKLFSHTVYLAVSGIGKVAAAMAAEALIAHFAPDAIINTGLAGGCDPALKPGDAVLAKKAVYHDFFSWPFDPDFAGGFTGDPLLLSLAKESLGALNLRHTEGTVATGDIFVESETVKQDIVRRTGCCCVDMEAAAVAHVAAANRIPLVVLKVISDSADENADGDFKQSLETYSHICASLANEIIRRLNPPQRAG